MMVRINLFFDEAILKELDEIAREEGTSRSAVLREAAQRLTRQYQREKPEETRKDSKRRG